MDRIQSKDHDIGSYKTSKISLSYYKMMTKNINLKMEHFHILISQLINHIKTISLNIDNLL